MRPTEAIALLLLLAWRFRAAIVLVIVGLLTLTGAAALGVLPTHPLGALLVGYLVYTAGTGLATVLLLLVVGPLLEHVERRGDAGE